ncbi:3690_t:CDS:2, partial [Racocetra fulgida]
MAKKYRISVSRAKEYIKNQEYKQQMIDESEMSQKLEAQLSPDSASSYLSQVQIKTSDRQIKKRRSKPKFIQVSDLSTNSDTQLEQVLNKGEKQIE